MPTNANPGLSCLTAITLASAIMGDGHAAKLTTLHSFGAGSDGAIPYATLINVSGTLFGTTFQGGTGSTGTVFQIDPLTGAESVVYSFGGPPDGALPHAALIDVGGTLYGTTELGGTADSGTVFQINPATGAESVVYNFIAPRRVRAQPECALIKVGRALYGTTTQYQGAAGTVFKFNLATGAGTIIHRFMGQPDGNYPIAGLINVGGTLYGTTSEGGATNNGAVFQINPKTRSESITYSLAGGADGASPESSLINVGGTLYGTTGAGGSGYGTVFQINPATGAERVIYRFTGGADGGIPVAALINIGGTLYGTTANGGRACGCGVVFKIDPASGLETVIHRFEGSDGNAPVSGLLNVDGTLYGTTYLGGTANLGTVFKLQR